jgi:osmoprotectant transport system substrate-binding protein
MKRILMHCILVLAVMILLLPTGCQDNVIRVASKTDTEGGLLAQMIILVLRANGFKVVDKSSLGSTQEVRKALLNGEVDIYPEYTGNGAIFFESTEPDIWKSAQESYEKVKELDKVHNNVVWLKPAPANNAWAIAISKKLADQENLWNMEQFANYVNHGGYVKIMASKEFATNELALPAFEKTYGFSLRVDQVVTISGGNSAVMEKAAANSTDGINAAMAYSTDGYLSALNLVVLSDNKNAQAIYQPTPTIRGEILEKCPEIADILNELFASLDSRTLQILNSKTGFIGGEFNYLVACKYLIDKGFLTNGPSSFPTDLPNIDLPDPTERSMEIINRMISVKPQPLWEETFEVDLKTMRNVKVVGWFISTGGSGNDIRVLVLDDIDFINWSNLHQVEGLYKTDKITTAKIDIPITASGKYHLVFDNRFSKFRSKDVLAKVYIYYESVEKIEAMP